MACVHCVKKTFEDYKSDYDVESIGESELVLRGGGDFYDFRGAPPDTETCLRASEIVTACGMRILSGHGEWYGWSEYTPDPGDVSVFTWVRE